jgi:DNA-binding response OmpR family regulator
MLSACKALVVGKSDSQVEFLTRTAQRCGFAFVESARGAPLPPARTLLRYFLIHYLLGDDALRSILPQIRRGTDEVRFAPVIIIADDPPFERVLEYVQMGVDDVISLPEKREVLVQRLATQLYSEHMYVETADYFGPDRRRMELGVSDSRRVGLAGHGRYFIKRNPDRGVQIVRHEIFAKPDEHGGLGPNGWRVAI